VRANISRPPSRPATAAQLEGMDPVRRWVTSVLHHALLTGQARPTRPKRPTVIKAVSGATATASVIMITVTLDNGTTRQFLVRMYETH